MSAVSRVRKLLVLLVACVPLCVGCGGEPVDTEPAEEPNAGPGMAPGGGTAEPKASPLPASKTEKAAPEKSAEKKK